MAGWPSIAREGWRPSRPAPSPDGRQAYPAPSSSASTPLLSAMIHGSCSSPCPVDPGDGAGADLSGVRGAAIGGERGAAAAQARAVPAAAPVPGLPAEPGGGGPLEGRDL